MENQHVKVMKKLSGRSEAPTEILRVEPFARIDVKHPLPEVRIKSTSGMAWVHVRKPLPNLRLPPHQA